MRHRPAADIGTALLHWSTVLAMTLSLLSGFRLTWDSTNPQAAGGRLLARLDGVLLTGDVWLVHLYAALALLALGLAYPLYLHRAALSPRNALGRLRLLLLRAPPRLKWQAGNIAIHWLLYALTLGLIASGLLLYTGRGGVLVSLHMGFAAALVVAVLAHMLGHFLQGGLAQWLRILWPARLTPGPQIKPLALPLALVAGVAGAAGLGWLDIEARPTLVLREASAAPPLDGTLAHPLWQGAPMVRVHTHQGANLADGQGQSQVELRALRHGGQVYFGFRWQDPSRSLKRLPLVKTAQGWRLLNDHADTADETAFYEDKFAVLIGTDPAPGGGITGMGKAPLPGLPGALNGRGLHYTHGPLLDLWQWKASRGGMLGHVDDMHVGPPYPADAAQRAGTARYSAGYLQDPGSAFYRYNYTAQPPGGYRAEVLPLRLPKDVAALTARLGRLDLTPGASDDEGSQWWLRDEDSEPYTPARDARIPVGTVLPSTLLGGSYSGDRADLAGEARWADGWWTLTVKRKAQTGSRFDLDFLPGGTLYIWVAVFDHTQTRHTRHLRPIRLMVPGA